MDTLHGRKQNRWRKSLTATTQECWEQFWTSPGGNTPQSSSYTATYHPSRKLSKLDEPDMQDTAGAHKWCTPVDPFSWTSKGRVTSSNLHTAALCKIQGVSQRTCRKRWTIGRGGVRVSRQDDEWFHYFVVVCSVHNNNTARKCNDKVIPCGYVFYVKQCHQYYYKWSSRCDLVWILNWNHNDYVYSLCLLHLLCCDFQLRQRDKEFRFGSNCSLQYQPSFPILFQTWPIYIYIYIYIFSPVKPESGIIPSGHIN